MDCPEEEFAQRMVQDEIAVALGRVVVGAGLLEHQLQDLAWMLMGVDAKTGLAVTAGLNFTPLQRMIRKLSRQALTQADFDDVSRLLDSAEKAMKLRNGYVHATWWVTEDGQGRIAGRTGEKHDVNRAELEELLEEILSLSNDFWERHRLFTVVLKVKRERQTKG